MFLIGRLLVGIAGRNLHRIDLELVVEIIQDCANCRRVVRIEKRRVGADAEAFFLGHFDGGDGFIERAIPADDLVVPLAHSIQVDHPRKVGRRLKLIDLLLEQQRIRADNHDFFASHEFVHEFWKLFVDQWFAAGDRDNRSAALFDRGETLLEAQTLAQRFGGMLNLSAARAREVTLIEWLEFHHQRVLLNARQLFAEDVFGDGGFLCERRAHETVKCWLSGEIPPSSRRAGRSIASAMAGKR